LLRQKEEAARLQREETLRQQEENQRRLAAQKEQRELQGRLLMEQQRIREEQKKREQALLLAEEARKREEERKKEMEKVIAIKEEQKRKQKEAEEAQLAVSEKARSFPASVHLAGCHQLTKLISHLPFPGPFLPYSSILKVYGDPNKDVLLAQTDSYAVNELTNALASVNAFDIKTKHEDNEDNVTDFACLPNLLKSIYQTDASVRLVFSTTPEVDMANCNASTIEVQPENQLQVPSDKCETLYAVDERGVVASTSAKADMDEFVQSSNALNNNETTVDTEIPRLTAEEVEEQTQLRKQIVSLGKQPKAQQGRKKKDMVESLYDSLTGYFDPSEGRRRRQKTKTFEEEQHERLQISNFECFSFGNGFKIRLPAVTSFFNKDYACSLATPLAFHFCKNVQMQLEMIAQMELAEAQEKERVAKVDVENTEHRPDHAGTSHETNEALEERPKFFVEGKKNRKRQQEELSDQLDRPPTPTEGRLIRFLSVIQQREIEWRERQRKRKEKHKRRKNNSESEYWNNEVMAEKESYVRLTSIIDQIFDNVENLDIVKGADEDDDEIPQELLIEKHQVEELLGEVQKLKSWNKINKLWDLREFKMVYFQTTVCSCVTPVLKSRVEDKVNSDRLVKLLTILEKNIRDVITVDGAQPLVPFFDEGDEDESDVTYRELVDDRILRALDASCTAMVIMTSPKMPKQVLIEDTIERSIQLCKQFLISIIYSASDAVSKSPTKSKKFEDKKRKKLWNFARSHTVERVYARVTELVGLFGELVRSESLTDTALLQLCSIATGPFFVDNVSELQTQAITLLSAIFSRYTEFRKGILQDLLNSLHRLPPVRNNRNSYRLSATDFISNFTVLMMQLVQCTVKIPKRRRSEETQTGSVDETEGNPDTVVKNSFNESQKVATMFLNGFLQKCTAKAEEDYRRLFDQFLHDLLSALYTPEWPAAEMMLCILGNLLVTFYRSKTMDMSLRIASLDYLGTITARLRRDVRQACSDEVRLDMVVKTILFDELDEADQNRDVNDIDTSELSTTDKMLKVQRALIDYLVEKKGDSDVSVEYAVMFYVGVWYRDCCLEAESAKQKLKQALTSSELNDKEKRKWEKKTEKLLERCQLMKDYNLKTADKKQIRKRAEQIARTGNILINSDALWLVKFLASGRELSQSFHAYLKQILYGIHVEQAVGLRTKAMRCLTQIIEADHEVLGMPEVQSAVQARMRDANAAVREATIELVGKYVILNPEFIPQYYPILIERIKDLGVAVRKRVIRIMRDLYEKQPEFEKIPEMLSAVVRRISDEESVKKLAIETFQTMWFQPVRERDDVSIVKKVMIITDMVQKCMKDNTVEFFEQLLSSLLKGGDRSILYASKQIVDTLVDSTGKANDESRAGNVESESSNLSAAASHKEHQERLLACLTTLSAFSKVRPELLVNHAETLQPYLSMNVSGTAEQQVLYQVINMLERVVPLFDHPPDSFLTSLDLSLTSLVKDSGMRIIASALSCIAAIHNKWKKRRPAAIDCFLSYLTIIISFISCWEERYYQIVERELSRFFLGFLNQVKDDIEHKSGYQVPQAKWPFVQRTLYTIGLMSRYFNLDEILENDEEARKNLSRFARKENEKSGSESNLSTVEEGKKASPFTDDVFRVLSLFCRNRDGAIRMKALTALGNFAAAHPDCLLKTETRNMYMTLLSVDDKEYLALKIQTLKNLELFLTSEETKLSKSNEEWQKAKEAHDLKEMELAHSGLASTIIQVYWNAVLTSYYSPYDTVRTAAVQVTMLTLNQGLVTPGSSIPTLIAMTTDSIPALRNKVDNVLRNIDAKYSGMVPSKAIPGIRCSFRLQKLLKKEPSMSLRGIRAVEQPPGAGKIKLQDGLPKMTNDGQAILSGLYQGLRSNRQQRRSFLSSVLRLFSEDCREKLSLEEWIFLADNIAMFPYQVMDEPLYVIRQIESIVSISGQNIINSFKSQLLPLPTGVGQDDDAIFNPELIYRRFPEDKTLLYECMKNSQACFLLLYLKNFLMKKVQEYSPSEAAKVYEKALSSRKNITIFYPQTALEELKPESATERETVKGQINMANQIVIFRNMLLSLDSVDDDEETAEEPVLQTTKESSEGEDTDVPAEPLPETLLNEDAATLANES
uniref:Nipped-B protein n=1 Tax=Enterobius vermicularis TaxID=51028 RepID=A0A0N4V606_ENTVE